MQEDVWFYRGDSYKTGCKWLIGRFEESDPNIINIIYLEIVKSYNKPLMDYNEAEVEKKINSDEIGKVLELVKALPQIKELMETVDNLNKQLNDKNEEGLTFLESFSGLLGKQYLFLQDDGTYYNRYTDEQMIGEEAVDWLYSELSSIINK